MKGKPYALCLKTLANDLRVQTLRELEKKPSSVQELCRALREEQSKVSHALQQLRTCHFVDARSVGKQRIYSLKPAVLKSLSADDKDPASRIFRFLDQHMALYCANGCPKAP